MKNIKEKLLIILGSGIVAFTIYNIHARYKIAEGGQLGTELLFYNWFGISPAVSSFIIDLTLILISYYIFGKKFLNNAILGTISYSVFYYLFQNIAYLLPDLSNNLLVATILGGLLVGIGCGIVIKYNGVCGGDDSLALILSKITKLNISLCYILLDIIIIIISLTYINVNNIFYSLLTAIISSIIIGIIYNKN